MTKRTKKLLAMMSAPPKLRRVSGAPPLTYKAKKAGFLTDYRIYGNTQNGEAVGDLVTSGEHAGEYNVPVTVEGKNLCNNYTSSSSTVSIDNNQITFSGVGTYAQICYLTLINPGIYTISFDAVSTQSESYLYFDGYPDSIYDGVESDLRFAVGTTKARYSGQYVILDGTTAIRLYRPITGLGRENTIVVSNVQIEHGNIATPYEPYHTPVTTPIYLPEQIKKVGNEEEYIDYNDQKLHRVGAEDIDVTLPEIPTVTGTNVLSVGTEVQPSLVEVTGRIRSVPTGGGE